ncbi:MAG TPA: hypothetical protein VFG11_00995 [Acidobacteriota bacterium]|nr:hypothetical protein [Acidobacteriota bacterium]
MILWIAALTILIVILVTAFIVIARKGRELRKSRPLPPTAKEATLEWTENGETSRIEIELPFYLGKNSDSHVVLLAAKAGFEACIFYHNSRFAFQSLDGAGIILLNGEEQLAGYLRDGDRLTIAGRDLTYRCT